MRDTNLVGVALGCGGVLMIALGSSCFFTPEVLPEPSGGASSTGDGAGGVGVGSSGVGGSTSGGGGEAGSGVGGAGTGGSNVGGEGGLGGSGGAGGTSPTCGNGIVEPPEMCDDNNSVNDDSCTNDCACGTNNLTEARAYVKDNHCYVWVREAKTWEEAKKECLGISMALASITSSDELQDVLKIGSMSESKLTDHTTWIGGKQPDEFSVSPYFPDSEWSWVNGEPWLVPSCYQVMVSCDLWNFGEPNDNGGSENHVQDCVAIDDGTDKFDDRGCSITRYFLCEAIIP